MDILENKVVFIVVEQNPVKKNKHYIFVFVAVILDIKNFLVLVVSNIVHKVVIY